MVSESGNGIYRGIILAVAGLMLAASQQQIKETATAVDRNPAESAAKNTRSPFKPIDRKYLANPGIYGDKCYNSTHQDSPDLCAQWRATLAAEKAAKEAERATFWSIIATFLSALGVGGLIFTLWQTQGALGEARRGNRISMKSNARSTRQSLASAKDTAKAIDAAEAQVRVSEQAAEKSLRAYLVVTDVRVENYLEGQSPTFWLSLKNMGKTPAKRVRGLANLFFESVAPQYRNGKPQLRFHLAQWESYRRNRGFILGPGETKKLKFTPLHKIAGNPSVPNIPNVSASVEGVEYAGIFSYVDYTNVQRRLVFCYILPSGYAVNGDGDLVPQNRGNNSN